MEKSQASQNDHPKELKDTSKIEREKRDFLKHEFFIMAFHGAVQHNHIYATGAQEKQKIDFRKDVEDKLNDIVKNLNKSETDSSDEEHFQRIQAFANSISKKHRDLLCENNASSRGLRIGTAQKLINLYLKYLWCAGYINITPPHCPFDRTILKELHFSDAENWTECDDLGSYMAWVVGATAKAKENGAASIAEWELHFFNKKREE